MTPLELNRQNLKSSEKTSLCRMITLCLFSSLFFYSGWWTIIANFEFDSCFLILFSLFSFLPPVLKLFFYSVLWVKLSLFAQNFQASISSFSPTEFFKNHKAKRMGFEREPRKRLIPRKMELEFKSFARAQCAATRSIQWPERGQKRYFHQGSCGFCFNEASFDTPIWDKKWCPLWSLQKCLPSCRKTHHGLVCLFPINCLRFKLGLRVPFEKIILVMSSHFSQDQVNRMS